jgi:uncharacterized membrane protein
MSHRHSLRDIRHFTGQVVWSVVVLALLVIVLYQWGSWWIAWTIIRVVIWTITLVYLPGFRITKAFWNREKLDLLEHTALSIAFSLSVVPVVIFYAHLTGLSITQGLIVWLVTCIVAVCAWVVVRRKQH